MKKLSSAFSDKPARRRIIFQNPSQVVALETLYDEFKNDPTKMSVIFNNAAQANAFLDVLNVLKGDSGTGNFQQLFDDPSDTMENIGLAKLKAEYDSQYHFIFDDNKERAAEIAATASKFKNDPEKLEIVLITLINSRILKVSSMSSSPLKRTNLEMISLSVTRLELIFSSPNLKIWMILKNSSDLLPMLV